MRRNNIEGLLVFGSGRDKWDRYVTNEVGGIAALSLDAEPAYLVGRFPLPRFDEPGQAFDRWVSDVRLGPPVKTITDFLCERGLDDKRVGVVGLSSRIHVEPAGSIPYRSWIAITAANPKTQFVDVAEQFEMMTMVKSPEEQEMLRKAAEIGDTACQAFIDACRPGARESEVGGAALGAIVAAGGWMAFPTLIMRSGRNRFAWGVPEWTSMGGGSRTIQAGDSVSAELFSFYGGFETQQQIDVSVGEPDDDLAFVADVATQSYRRGLEILRPGVKFSQLSDAMHEPLVEAGCWNTGPHIQTVSPVIFNSPTHINVAIDPGMAHLPALPPEVPRDGEFTVEAGVAFAFEPNALRNQRRVCIGGTVLVTENGYEELNSVPNQLHVVPA
ncbi:M24 family metallopeptidase [Streptomyces sp. NPDC056817]|uniref:M24 family metallopeptidase n=1 Tax=Streptomyces sp. NPDC056817 TaxID=3345950 RepID=UPI0036C107B5